MIIHNPILTGSLQLNGTSLSTGNIVTTGSNTFVGNQVVSGSLNLSGSITATGTLTAQTLVVQTVTSSVVYSSGSNVFGNVISNTHQFTGSVSVSGSATFASTIRSNDDSGLALGSIAGYRRLQYVLANTKFSFLTDTNSLANIEANAATFSEQIKTTFAGQSISVNAASTDSVRIQLQNNNVGNSIVAVESSAGGSQFTGTTAYSMAIGTATARDLFLGTNSVQRLKIDASTGAATFASSISAGTFLGVTRAGANDVGSGPYVVIAQPTSAIQWLMQLNASAGLDYWHYNGSAWSTPLRLASSGAATFSNSVTTTKANTFKSSISVPYNTATLMQVCAADGGQGSMYLIVAAIGGAGTENIAMGILVTIAQGGGTARWAFQNNGAQLTLTDPGSNGYIYVTQTKAGGSETVNYSILRIG